MIAIYTFSIRLINKNYGLKQQLPISTQLRLSQHNNNAKNIDIHWTISQLDQQLQLAGKST